MTRRQFAKAGKAKGLSRRLTKVTGMRKWVFVLFLAVAVAEVALAEVPTKFEQAYSALENRQHERAFELFSSIKGGGALATEIARQNPAHFLALLEGCAGPEVGMIRADLHFQLGNQEKALALFREAQPDKNGYYVFGVVPFSGREPQAFLLGPGGPTDNWLLARFLSLKAWPEARQEYSRVWALHLQRQGSESPFDSLALRFAVDYTDFLLERGLEKEAKVVFVTIGSRIDLDKFVDRTPPQSARRSLPAKTTQREFLAKAARIASKDIESALAGNGSKLRTLAELSRFRGDYEAAQRLELEYLAWLKPDDFSKSYRLGRLLELSSQREEARTHYKQALQSLARSKTLNIPDPRGGLNEWELRAWNEGDRKRLLRELLSERIAFLAPPPEPEDILARQAAAFLKKTTTYESQLTEWLTGLESNFSAIKRLEEFKNWAKSGALDKSNPPLVRAVLWKKLGNNERYKELALHSAKEWMAREQARDWKQKGPNTSLIDAQLRLLDLRGDSWSEEAFDLKFRKRPNSNSALLYLDYLGKTKKAESFARVLDECLNPDGLLSREWKNYKPRAYGSNSLENLLMLALLYGNKRIVWLVEARLSGHPDSPVYTAISGLRGRMTSSTAVLNLPKSAVLVTDLPRYSCLTRGPDHLFLGTEWGVDIFELNGKHHGQLSLGSRTNDLLFKNNALWAATDHGLLRIQPKTWDVERVALNDVKKARYNNQSESPQRVASLATTGDLLWLISHGNSASYNLSKNLLTYYHKDEFPSPGHLYQDHDAAWIGNLHVASDGSRTPVLHEGERVYPFSEIQGRLWAQVKSGKNVLPVMIDRDTLAVKPVNIQGAPKAGKAWKHYGSLNGQAILSSGKSFWRLSASGLKPINHIDPENRYGIPFANTPGFEPISRFDRANKAQVETLTDGRVAILSGSRLIFCEPTLESFEKAKKEPQRRKGIYHSAFFGAKTSWFAASNGVLVLPENGSRIFDFFPRNRSSQHAVKLGSVIYFVQRESLLVYHTDKRLFIQYPIPSLKGDIRSFEADGETLQIVMRSSSSNSLVSGSLDLKTLEWTPGPLSKTTPKITQRNQDPLTNLVANDTIQRGQSTYYLGSNLVVVPTGYEQERKVLAPEFVFSKKLRASLEPKPEDTLKNRSERLAHQFRSPDLVVRRKAIDSIWQGHIESNLPLLEKAAGDADLEIRQQALKKLSLCFENDATEIIRRLAKDKEPSIRAPANLQLLLRGLEADSAIVLEACRKKRPRLNSDSLLPLAMHEDIESTLPLIWFLKPDSEAFVKVLAGRFRESPNLVSLSMRSEDRFERAYVLRVLSAVGPSLLPNVRPFLKSDDVSTRLLAAQVCSEYQDEAAIPALQGLLESQDSETSRGALYALGSLGTVKSLIPLMREFELARSRETSGKRAHSGLLSTRDIANALAKVGATEAQPHFRQILQMGFGTEQLVLALAAAKGDDIKTNIEFLKVAPLISNFDESSAVALFLLDREEGENRLRKLLLSDKKRTRTLTLLRSRKSIHSELRKRFPEVEFPDWMTRD